MEVTLVGLLCVLTGVVCLRRGIWLSFMLAASVTFSGTAVFNFPSLPFGFQPYHWFGSLLVLRSLVFRPRALQQSVMTSRTGAWMLAFVIWAGVAAAATGMQGTSIAHVSHLVFGLAVYSCLLTNINNERDFASVLNGLIWGCIFAAGWAFLQASLFLLGVPYPATLFNNSVGQFASGFDATLFGGLIPRVSSVATEPSYLVRSLVPVAAFLIIVRSIRPGSYGLIETGSRSWYIPVLIAATLITTSSLGLLGLVTVLVMQVCFAHRRRLRTLLISVSLTLISVLLFGSSDVANALIEELVIGKMELGSGADRLESVGSAIEAFQHSPLTGAGPGLVTSHDLFIKLLSNFGVPGLAFFLLSIASATRTAVKRRRGAPQSAKLIMSGLIAANATLWLMDTLAGVSYQYGIFWILLALLGATRRLHAAPVAKIQITAIPERVVVNA